MHGIRSERSYEEEAAGFESRCNIRSKQAYNLNSLIKHLTLNLICYYFIQLYNQ